MKASFSFLMMLLLASTAGAEGRYITYQVSGDAYEGYYVRASADAPLVLLVHDWDGLTDYEIQRAMMLSALGW